MYNNFKYKILNKILEIDDKTFYKMKLINKDFYDIGYKRLIIKEDKLKKLLEEYGIKNVSELYYMVQINKDNRIKFINNMMYYGGEKYFVCCNKYFLTKMELNMHLKKTCVHRCVYCFYLENRYKSISKFDKNRLKDHYSFYHNYK